MKCLIFKLFVCTALILSSLSALIYSDHNVLTVPVVPKSSMNKSEALNKEQLNLKVNGVPRSIYKISKIEKSLKKTQDMGRDVVLSFMTTEANENLCRGISYFISDVLRENDSLIIVTPLKAYKIKL